jgi:hypothetical protein
MEAWHWLENNFAGLLNATGIVGSLLFTAISFRGDKRERELSNLISLTEAHRDIWSRFHDEPKLARVLNPEADAISAPATEKEEIFVTSLVLHLYCVHRAIKLGMYPNLEGLRRDIRELYSLPIPNQVWERIKPLQDRDFVAFVEHSLQSDDQRSAR